MYPGQPGSLALQEPILTKLICFAWSSLLQPVGRTKQQGRGVSSASCCVLRAHQLSQIMLGKDARCFTARDTVISQGAVRTESKPCPPGASGLTFPCPLWALSAHEPGPAAGAVEQLLGAAEAL